MKVNLDSNNTNFVIAGGGAAGWLTALQVRQYYPDVNVTVIESSDIGILGAGEGSVPQLIDILDNIEIPVSEVVKHADATIKHGIKLTNWNGKGKDDIFYSSFASADGIDYAANSRIDYSLMSMIALEKIAKGEPIVNINFTALTCNNNKVKFITNPDIKNKATNPITHFYNLGQFSIHFNAVKFANFLKGIGTLRNINIVDGIIKKINEDEGGYINSFDLEDGRNIPCDFVFDCTGFKRLIVGNHYKAKWKSYKEYLPVNRAMPFFMPLNENQPIPSYTEAIALKYGWMWKIPTQERFGCGYVFDSNLVSDEEAKKEIDEITGVDTNIPRVFSFEPGVFETPWVKNSIAIGLASGFVEPLEATSIQVALSSFTHFLVYVKGAVERDEAQIKMYNKALQNINNDILNFIHFHYLTQRTDTIFWKDFAARNKCPNVVQEIKDSNRDVAHLLSRDFITNSLFQIGLWLEVGAGTRFFNREEAIKSYNALNTGTRKVRYSASAANFIKKMNLGFMSLIDHRDFLNYLKFN